MPRTLLLGVTALAFAACGPTPTEEDPASTGGISPRVSALTGPSLAPPAEEVRLSLSGPHDTTLVGMPGDTVEIDDLEPDQYQMKLEGLRDAYVVWSSRQRVIVLPGTVSEPEVEPVPFEVSDLMTTSTLPLTGGAPLDLEWTGTPAALEYRVAWSGQSDFSTIDGDTVVAGSPASVPLEAVGTYWVRVVPLDSAGVSGWPVVLADSVEVGS